MSLYFLSVSCLTYLGMLWEDFNLVHVGLVMCSAAYRRHSYNLYFGLCKAPVTHEESGSQRKIRGPNICGL